jgi:hypothetical protein
MKSNTKVRQLFDKTTNNNSLIAETSIAAQSSKTNEALFSAIRKQPGSVSYSL